MVVEEVDEETAGLVSVGEWPSLSQAREHALVVLAMNLDCWIFPGEESYALHAEPAQVPRIRQEFALYAAEQAERHERVELPVFPAGMELAMVWALALLAVFWWQIKDPGLADRFCNSTTALVEGGEWWRAFTALFLHADGGHLLSNLAIGGIFCVMVAHTVGAWRGWLLIVTAGTVANLANAWLRYPSDFTALGASTATFAAVGILTGVATLRAWRMHSLRELRPLLAPLLTGLVVLGWYGSGGDGPDRANIDVPGHVLGWLCGGLLGALALGWSDRWPEPAK